MIFSLELKDKYLSLKEVCPDSATGELRKLTLLEHHDQDLCV